MRHGTGDERAAKAPALADIPKQAKVGQAKIGGKAKPKAKTKKGK
jgi:hypothetical protein